MNFTWFGLFVVIYLNKLVRLLSGVDTSTLIYLFLIWLVQTPEPCSSFSYMDSKLTNTQMRNKVYSFRFSVLMQLNVSSHSIGKNSTEGGSWKLHKRNIEKLCVCVWIEFKKLNLSWKLKEEGSRRTRKFPLNILVVQEN